MSNETTDCTLTGPPAIILVDRDEIYLSRMARRLQELLPATVLTAGSQEMLVRLLSDNPDLERGVILADRATCAMIGTQAQVNRRFQVAEWLENPPSDAAQPYRLMPVQQLAAWLKTGFPDVYQDDAQKVLPADLPDILAGQNLEQPDFPGFTSNPLAGRQTVDRGLKASGENDLRLAGNLLLALDLGWPFHRVWLRQHIADAVASGRQVIYLPLMPTYRMALLQAPGRGLNLTALVLRLTNGEDVQPQDLGLYLEPHHDGYWQFRPPERADDLIQATLPALHDLVSLLRRKILQHGSDQLPGSEKPSGPDGLAAGNIAAAGVTAADSTHALAVIDCSGLPLRTVTALAVMADIFAVRFEPGVDWCTTTGQRELGTVMAKLPSSCKIVEMKSRSES